MILKHIPSLKNLSVLLLLATATVAKSQTANSWTQKASFVNGREDAVAFSIGTKAYVGTGHNIGNYNDFWEFDPVANTWTQKANITGARYGGVGFSIGSKGYAGLGASSTTMSDFYEYDPVANTWTQKTSFPGGGRVDAVGFSIGNKGYAGTGDGGSTTLYNDFYEYDPATNAWTQKASFAGGARFAAVGLGIGNKGYIGTGSNFVYQAKDFWEYNPATDTWTQKADFAGYARLNAAAFSIGNLGYVGTGHDYLSNFRQDFWQYNPASDMWTQKANFSGIIRAQCVGVSVGKKGYMGLGSAGGDLNTFYEYLPDSLQTLWISKTAACAGDVIKITFGGAASYNTGNIFTAQLSSAGGSFSNPVNIGTLTATTTDTMTATIPAAITSGQYYRIRVVSSNPALTGIDNGVDIRIDTTVTPSVTITPATISICAGNAVTLTASGTNGGTLPVYQWTVNSIAAGTDTNTITVTPANHDTIRCIYISNAQCRTHDSAFSNKVIAVVHPLPAVPVVTVSGDILSTGSYAAYQWYRNGSAVVNAHGQSFTATQNGSYTVSVTDTSGCTNTSQPVVLSHVSVNNLANTGSRISVYPNPVKDQLFIDAPQPVNISIKDITGKTLILHETGNVHQLKSLARGYYLLLIYDNTNRLMKTEKLIKAE